MNRANVLSAADDENFPHMSEPTLPESRKAKASTAKWRKRFYLLGTLVLACVLIYLLGVVMGVLALPLSILVWCIIFIFCLYPLVDWLQERGIKRGLGTTIAYVVMIAIVALAVWLGVSPAFGLSDQFESINDSIPVYSQQFMDWYQGLASRYSALFQNGVVQQAVQSASDSFYQATGSFSNALASGIVNFGTFLVNSCIVIGFALVISFWILMDLPGIRREARRLVNPAHADDFSVISHTFNRSIGGYIKGTLLQCLIIGVACGVGYAIIGVPNAAACGVITGILNIIPVVGPWLGGIVAGGIGLMNSPTVAVISIIIAIIVQQVVYTFVSPIIMRDAVDIHPALMIFALMCGSAIGMYMGGLMGNIIGMLAAVPLTAAGNRCSCIFTSSVLVVRLYRRTVCSSKRTLRQAARWIRSRMQLPMPRSRRRTRSCRSCATTRRAIAHPSKRFAIAHGATATAFRIVGLPVEMRPIGMRSIMQAAASSLLQVLRPSCAFPASESERHYASAVLRKCVRFSCSCRRESAPYARKTDGQIELSLCTARKGVNIACDYFPTGIGGRGDSYSASLES